MAHPDVSGEWLYIGAPSVSTTSEDDIGVAFVYRNLTVAVSASDTYTSATHSRLKHEAIQIALHTAALLYSRAQAFAAHGLHTSMARKRPEVSSTIPTTHLCTVAHYSVAKGCVQDDHTMTAADITLAYIVTDIPVSYNDVSAYHIFQPQSDGTTNEVAIKAADMSSEGKVFRTRLSDIWNAQGADTTPGTYDFVTEYGVGDTLHDAAGEPPLRVSGASNCV